MGRGDRSRCHGSHQLRVQHVAFAGYARSIYAGTYNEFPRGKGRPGARRDTPLDHNP
jgi:hypothetical protein